MTTLASLPMTPHQRGAALEELLNWQHAIYQANGRATIWHNGTKGEIHHGKAVLVKSRPDYEGILSQMAGRHVALDAKTCATWTYHHDRRRLHQLVDLYDVRQAGGLSFLLVSLNLEHFYIVWPQPCWETMRGFSVDLRMIDRGGEELGLIVPVSGSNKLPDWLTTLEAQV